jgi:hypothetical protein
MNAVNTPGRPRSDDAARELLQAIHDYLDLPFVADWAEEPKRDKELQDRVAQLVGRLEIALADDAVEGIAETIRGDQARALPYAPETPAQTAERHATLAAELARRREELTAGARRDPRPVAGTPPPDTARPTPGSRSGSHRSTSRSPGSKRRRPANPHDHS